MGFELSLQPYGDIAVLAQFSGAQKDEASPHILSLYDNLPELKTRRTLGIVNIVPAYDSLMIEFDPLVTDYDAICALIWAAKHSSTPETNHKPPLEIPACYEGDFAPDMRAVSTASGLSVPQIVAKHSAKIYTVCMCSFLPGFSYLSAIDPALDMPRRAHPRANVAAGSIGIGGWQTGIYGIASPGGWNIIARTPRPLFDPTANKPFTLSPSDRVKFIPIKASEMERLCR